MSKVFEVIRPSKVKVYTPRASLKLNYFKTVKILLSSVEFGYFRVKNNNMHKHIHTHYFRVHSNGNFSYEEC